MLSPQRDKRQGQHDDAVVKRVSRRASDEDHGGAWKVAFADFCLALMCLFLVLWVMAAREQERIQEAMRTPGGSVMDEGQGIMPETMGGPRGSLIAREPLPHRGENDPTEPHLASPAPKPRYESPQELQVLAQALARLSADAGLAANLQTIVTPQGLRVMLHDTDREGMFERGSATPSERFRRLLRRMGPLFAQMENQMLIVGHTDALQYADRSYAAFSNWTLSSNRAMAARAQLLAGGMPASGVLQVVGMADRAPIDTEDATAGINRRIEMLVLTSRQAQTVAAMFGLPREVVPLADGVDSVLPDGPAMRALRQQLTGKTKGHADAE